MQGGIGKIGTLMVKGAAKAVVTLGKRGAFAVVSHSHLLKQSLAGIWTKNEARALAAGLGKAGKLPINDAVKITIGDQLENHLRKQFINRNKWNIKKILEAAKKGPNLKRLIAREGGEELFWRRLALFTHLMGDEANELLMRNFLKVMDEKLIYDIAGQPVDWADDFLRCFKDSPPAFVNREPLSSLEDYQKNLLKGFLSGPDVGDIYKLGTIDGRGNRVRGLIVEFEHHYKQYFDWDHTPDGFAVDWTKAPRAVQMKSINSASDWQENNLAGAINKLIDWQKTNSSVTELTLSIKKNPSLDTEALEKVLLDYIDLLKEADDFPDGVKILLDVQPFTFMP